MELSACSIIFVLNCTVLTSNPTQPPTLFCHIIFFPSLLLQPNDPVIELWLAVPPSARSLASKLAFYNRCLPLLLLLLLLWLLLRRVASAELANGFRLEMGEMGTSRSR